MSDSENRKVQDILREVAGSECTGINSGTLIRHICDALGKSPDSITYGDDLRKCLIEIADRIDKQSVVEVQVPMPSDPFARITELYPMTHAEAISAIEHWLAGRGVAPQEAPELEPNSDQSEPAELEALTPAIIDVHDCIIDVHIHGGIDDQD